MVQNKMQQKYLVYFFLLQTLLLLDLLKKHNADLQNLARICKKMRF